MSGAASDALGSGGQGGVVGRALPLLPLDDRLDRLLEQQRRVLHHEVGGQVPGGLALLGPPRPRRAARAGGEQVDAVRLVQVPHGQIAMLTHGQGDLRVARPQRQVVERLRHGLQRPGGVPRSGQLTAVRQQQLVASRAGVAAHLHRLPRQRRDEGVCLVGHKHAPVPLPPPRPPAERAVPGHLRVLVLRALRRHIQRGQRLPDRTRHDLEVVHGAVRAGAPVPRPGARLRPARATGRDPGVRVSGLRAADPARLGPGRRPVQRPRAEVVRRRARTRTAAAAHSPPDGARDGAPGCRRATASGRRAPR